MLGIRYCTALMNLSLSHFRHLSNVVYLVKCFDDIFGFLGSSIFLALEVTHTKQQQMAMKAEFLLILLTLANTKFSIAFTPYHKSSNGVYCSMVGGRGWDNGDYLSGLSGDEEDRKKIEDDYQDFHERRSAFQERQREYLEKSPQARAFLEQQQAQPMGDRDGLINEDMDPFEEFGNLQAGSGGGTRMAQMMAQSKRMQQPRSSSPMFQQKLAVPLEDDNSDPKRKKEDNTEN